MSRTLRYALLGAFAVVAGTAVIATAAGAAGRSARLGARRGDATARAAVTGNGSGTATTATPIKHVVVIYQENVSFDHYFGTYPNAANTAGQTFSAAPGTPAVAGLAPATSPTLPLRLRHSINLLTSNPNQANPQRLSSTVDTGTGQLTCDQDHDYSDEQKAFDSGRMDAFVQATGTASGTGPTGAPCQAGQVMDYYDGNTVTGLWNYAQHYAMSDDSFGTTFGPSTPGAINLTSGNTGNVDVSRSANSPSLSTATSPNGDLTANGKGGYSLTSDAQPYWDDCSTRDAVAMSGTNIGDELNHAGLAWGWFQGGLRPTTTYQQALGVIGQSGQSDATFLPDEFTAAKLNSAVPNASNESLCDAVHPVGAALGGTGQYGYKNDYITHHEPFQYYASTANPHHLTVATDSTGKDTTAGLQEIGTDSQSYVNGAPEFNTPNHQYDTTDFGQLVAAINQGQLPATALPAVTFLKAPGYQDGHAGYSDPADEQAFLTKTINALMQSPDWSSTAVIINYDDSDGWYDHIFSGIHNSSLSPADNLTETQLTGPTSGKCLTEVGNHTVGPLNGEQGRCGFGPRLPLLVISPYAKANFVDHHLSDQASIINFIEYNWGLPGIPGSADQVLAQHDKNRGLPFDLAGMFDFDQTANPALFLNPATGKPQAKP